MNYNEDDRRFMELALMEARTAFDMDEVPVAAVWYVTVEPCVMCAGAIGWSQIRRIVVGASDPKRGYSTVVSRPPFHPKAVVVTGVLADECASLMRAFFARKR